MVERICTKCHKRIKAGSKLAIYCQCYLPIKNGKTKKDWLRARSRWLKENPPNHQGYYICYICGKWVDSKDITLDHVLPRSHRPDLRVDFSNLRPCCWECNTKKGSKH